MNDFADVSSYSYQKNLVLMLMSMFQKKEASFVVYFVLTN